jgi:hypothetical protein
MVNEAVLALCYSFFLRPSPQLARNRGILERRYNGCLGLPLLLVGSAKMLRFFSQGMMESLIFARSTIFAHVFTVSTS